jgi:glycosyltransferase involved in cell wall biosynthesis
MTLRKPVVLHIIAGFALAGPLGGIERFGVQLAQAFDRTRVTPIVCGLWDFGTGYEQKWVRHLKAHGISAFIAAPWQEAHPYRAFWQAMQGVMRQVQYPIDIIHSHYEFGDIAAVLLKHQLGAKHLLRTVHNEREWPKRWLRRLILTNLLWVLLFDREFGVSRQVVTNLNARPLARLLRKHGIVAYNSVDLARFQQSLYTREQVRAIWGIPHDARLLISIGRLTEQKGYRFLLEAMHHVKRKRHDVHLVLIGTGPLEIELRRLASKLNLGASVHFAGRRLDVEHLLPHFDLFISSSLWEGLPTVILEAMAAKVPVIGTAVSGTSELIEHGRTGLLIPPGDPKQLAEAILYMLDHPDVMQYMIQASYEVVRTRFSIEAVARQYERIYEQLLYGKI